MSTQAQSVVGFSKWPDSHPGMVSVLHFMVSILHFTF